MNLLARLLHYRTMALALCIAALAATFARRGEGAEIVLAADGKCDYQIVLPNQAPSPTVGESLRQTARLIQTALVANGFVPEVPIVAEADRDPAKPAIFLGATQFAQEYGVDVVRFRAWAYAQKVVGKNVIIAGRDQPAPEVAAKLRRPAWDRLGTVKGAVDFLHQFVGVRFVFPDLAPYSAPHQAAKIDLLSSPAFEFLKTPTVVVPADLNRVKQPTIEFNTAHPARGSFYDIAHNRFPLTDTLFGGHTYERAVPREKFADSNPEYFALLGGKRTAKDPGNAQYCISNPDVRELIYQDLLNGIDQGYECVDVGQPDGFRACQCEACAKLYDTGSNWGEKLWLFQRDLAARVEKARPGKIVTMMSYIQTELPPKSFQSFPANTRVLLTGTNEEDIAPWRGHTVPRGFSSYIYNWCPNLGSRYTPMRTPRFVEAQAKRLVANKIVSIYRDGPGDLFGLEGPTYYTMGRMFDDPDQLTAKSLVQEYCLAAYGKSAPSMIAFFDQLYHGIELYSEFLGTRSPAWSYSDIYGRRRKYLTDPFQFLGFLYTPSLLASLESQLAAAERSADADKTRQRLAEVRREFDYLKHLARVIHLHHAFETQPDLASRERLLNAIDARNAFVNAMFDATRRGQPVQLPGFSFVMFPALGHDAKHLRLSYNGYQEPFENTALNWDTAAMRRAPLPGAKRLAVRLSREPIALDSANWEKAKPYALTRLGAAGSASASAPANTAGAGPKTSFQMQANERGLYLRVVSELPANGAAGNTNVASPPQELLDLYLEPIGTAPKADAATVANAAAKPTGKLSYRFTGGLGGDSKQEAANGLVTDLLDPRFGRFDPDWNGEWRYETRLQKRDAGQRQWIALFHVPFATLGQDAPTDGAFWRGNVARVTTINGQSERSLWSASPGTKTLDDANDFGEFTFEAVDKSAAVSGPPPKLPLTELREKLYGTSFQVPAEWQPLIQKTADTMPIAADSWLFRTDPLELGVKENWARPDLATTEWLKLPVPSFWAETEAVGKYTGYGWHRATVQLPVAWKGRALRLLIGAADEQAWVYWNGQLIREHSEKSESKSINDLWESPFTANVPADRLDFSQPNVLVIRIHNSLANGGLWRPVWITNASP